MKMEFAKKDGDAIVRLSGDMDHHSAIGTREEIDLFLEEGDVKRLLMDLSGMQFMDSSGLGLILGRFRKCEEKGIKFVLLNPNDGVLKILRFAGVEKMITVKYL